LDCRLNVLAILREKGRYKLRFAKGDETIAVLAQMDGRPMGCSLLNCTALRAPPLPFHYVRSLEATNGATVPDCNPHPRTPLGNMTLVQLADVFLVPTTSVAAA